MFRPLLICLALGCAPRNKTPGIAVAEGVPSDTWFAGVWTHLEAAPSLEGNQDDLWCFDAESCIAVNSRGQIWSTADGGDTWAQRLDQPETFFRAVAFSTPQVGVATNIGPGLAPWVTDSTILYRTEDGGHSWQPVDVGRDDIPGLCNLDAVGADTFWASGRVSGPSWVGRSTNAGVTWSWFDVSDHLEQVIDLEFAEPDVGLVIGSMEGRSRVIRTTDAGASWTVVYDGERQGELPWKISFPTPKVGFIGVQNQTDSGSTPVLRTDDGGQSWQRHEAVARPYRAKGIGFADANVGWLAGEDQAFATRDGGRTWTPVPGLHASVNRFRFPSPGVGFAIGTKVWKLDVR